MNVELTLNGRPATLEARSDEMLLVALRRAGLLSVRETCGIGMCGACTVLLDGEPVSGCLTLAAQAAGRELTTVEGLAPPGGLHPLQEGFKDEHGLQCGFCTPGMMLAAKALLEENPDPTEDEKRQAISGNLCRCTGYQNIVDAVKLAAEKMRESDRAGGVL
jgi:carbon-monoxide dehydrogenase small subunit